MPDWYSLVYFVFSYLTNSQDTFQLKTCSTIFREKLAENKRNIIKTLESVSLLKPATKLFLHICTKFQPALKWLKLLIETLAQGVKYVQS